MDIFNILSIKINTAGNPTKEQLRLKSLELSPLAFVKLKPSFLFLFTRIHTKK